MIKKKEKRESIPMFASLQVYDLPLGHLRGVNEFIQLLVGTVFLKLNSNVMQF